MKRWRLTNLFSLLDVSLLFRQQEVALHENMCYSGDIAARDETRGLLLRSPDGNWWRVTIDNAGALTSSSLATTTRPE